MKCSLCVDGSRMIKGIDFELLYVSVIDMDSLLLMIALASSKGRKFYLLDISNAFQSNVIHDPTKRHYLHIPSLYMKWFHIHFSNHL